MLTMRYQFFPLALLAASGAVLYLAQAAEMPDSEQVTTLLRDVKTQAVLLSQDASTLEGYTREGASWETHAAAVEQMRTHINEAGKILTKLKADRKMASPWQATAIDRVEPLLRELAGYTEGVIKYLADNPKRLMLEGYKDHVEANADVSSQLASLIGDFVDYGNSKRRMEQLGAKLELPKH